MAAKIQDGRHYSWFYGNCCNSCVHYKIILKIRKIVYLYIKLQEIKCIHINKFNMTAKIQDGRHEIMFSNSSNSNIYNTDIHCTHWS